MKKTITTMVALLMTLTLGCSALAQAYYTLPEVREQAKAGWHQTYTDKYGRETVVDIDIDVFGEEKAPVLRAGIQGYDDYVFMQNNPTQSLVDARAKKGGGKYYIFESMMGTKIDMDHQYGGEYGNSLTPREMVAILESLLNEKGLSPADYQFLYEQPETFEVLCSMNEKKNKVVASAFYRVDLWPRMYGLPLMTHVGDGFVYEGSGPWCNPTSGFQIRNREEYAFRTTQFVEQEVLAKDIPLCSVERVIEAAEKQIEAGHIQRVNSLRFGYVLYNDPSISVREAVEASDVESWYLVPSWVLECKYSKKPKEDCKEDDWNRRVIINAQTGKMVDPLDRSLKGRVGYGDARYKGFIPWDDVN